MDTETPTPRLFDLEPLTDAQIGNLAFQGKSWANIFWPGRTVDPQMVRHLRFDDVGTHFHHRVRYMPTADSVVCATMHFGAPVKPILAAWRKLWDECLDVDARAKADKARLVEESSAQEPGEPPIGGYLTRSTLLDDAHHWARQGRPRRAARLFAQAECWDEEAIRLAKPRSRAQHVLEDALIMISLARAGVPFTASTFGFGAATFVKDGDGFREFDLDAEDDGLDPVRTSLRESRQTTNPYWISRAFRESAGRGMSVVRGVDELVLTLMDMRGQGHRNAFLKSIRSKDGTWVIPLEGAMTFDEMDVRLHAVLGRRYAGLFSGNFLDDGFLVQEFVPFAKEHRFFVVGDRVVASTASDRALSVLDIRGRILDDRVAVLDAPARDAGAYDRGSSTAPVDRALVARMAREARRIVRAMRDEGKIGDCYVLDMGVTVRSLEEGGEEILPVEVNTLLYAGLYAVDWQRVSDALARRAVRGGRPPGGGDVVRIVGNNSWSAVPDASGGFTVTAKERPLPIVDRILAKVARKRAEVAKASDEVDTAAADVALLVSRMSGMLQNLDRKPSLDD